MSCGADRFVPLPAATLSGLRRHWRTHRHPRLIFPALGRGRNRAAAADCQAVPSAEASIEYLAPYVFKAAISDHRILSFTEGCVRFSYQKSGSTRPRVMTLDALEFIRRFLQHVLPTGFMKVRYYGFLSPTAKTPLETVIAKVELASGFTLSVPEVALAP